MEHARQLSVVAGSFLGSGQSMTLGARDIRK
jgi:hypothetical protein